MLLDSEKREMRGSKRGGWGKAGGEGRQQRRRTAEGKLAEDEVESASCFCSNLPPVCCSCCCFVYGRADVLRDPCRLLLNGYSCTGMSQICGPDCQRSDFELRCQVVRRRESEALSSCILPITPRSSINFIPHHPAILAAPLASR